MVTYCCVRGCKKKKDDDDKAISHHGFPSDPYFKALWVDAIKKHDKQKMDSNWTPKKCHCICSRHFMPSSFRKDRGLNLLVAGAIPTIFTNADADVEQITILLKVEDNESNLEELYEPSAKRAKKIVSLLKQPNQTVMQTNNIYSDQNLLSAKIQELETQLHIKSHSLTMALKSNLTLKRTLDLAYREMKDEKKMIQNLKMKLEVYHRMSSIGKWTSPKQHLAAFIHSKVTQTCSNYQQKLNSSSEEDFDEHLIDLLKHLTRLYIKIKLFIKIVGHRKSLYRAN